MDGQLRGRIDQFVRDLASEEQQRLSEAGTFVSLELLTAEIGDEIARKLASLELSRRAEAVAETRQHGCPDCGRECPVEPDREPLILQGFRGEIEYQEPRCHCPRCRRDFFPSGTTPGPRPSGIGHPTDSAQGGLGRSHVGKLSTGGRRTGRTGWRPSGS